MLALGDASDSVVVASSSGALDGDESARQQRERFLVFHLTQLALIVVVLFEGIHLLFFLPAVVDLDGVRAYSDPINLVLVVLSVLPTTAWCLSQRCAPTWWIWADFALAAVSLALIVAALVTGERASDVLYGVTVLLGGLRLYVRQVVFNDVAHSSWHTLHVGQASPRVSSFLITHRACSVLLRAFPWANALFVLLAMVAAAQVPLTSLLVSRAVSSKQGFLDVGFAIGLLALVIGAGQLASAGMGAASARIFSGGSVLVQRRFALSALYGPDENPGKLTSTFSQGLAKVQALWTSVYWSLLFFGLQLALNLGFMLSVDPVVHSSKSEQPTQESPLRPVLHAVRTT